MVEYFGLRAEDFQKAWPHAYQQAVQQVAILQEYTERQLQVANSQVILARQAAQTSTRELNQARTTLVDTLKTATDGHVAVLKDASSVLAQSALDLHKSEREFNQERMRMTKLLAQERMKFDALRNSLLNAPLWRRVIWAFRPR